MLNANYCCYIHEAERNKAIVKSIFLDAPQGKLPGVPIQLGESRDSVLDTLKEHFESDGTYLFFYNSKEIIVRFSSRKVSYIETIYYDVPIAAFPKAHTEEYHEFIKRHYFFPQGRSGERYHLYAVASAPRHSTQVILSTYAIR